MVMVVIMIMMVVMILMVVMVMVVAVMIGGGDGGVVNLRLRDAFARVLGVRLLL